MLPCVSTYPCPYPNPYPSVSEFPRLLPFGFLELIAPTEDTRLGAMMLGLGLVAPLHPDAGHRSVDMDVLGAQREGLFAGGEGIIILTRGEVDLGLREPGFEAGRIGRNRRLQLREGRGFVADSEGKRTGGSARRLLRLPGLACIDEAA